MSYGPAQPAYGPYPPYGPPRPAATNGLSIAALVVGIAGLLFVAVPFAGVVLPVAAVALGGAGTGRSRQSGAGRGMGIAGLVLGAVGVLLAVAVTTLFLIIWPRISACTDPAFTAQERASCLRQQFGLPEPTGPSDVSLTGLPLLVVTLR